MAADAVQEPVHLALRVMEAPGGTPAIRAPENRLVAVGLANPVEFDGRDVRRLVPRQFHEIVRSAAVAVPPFQPAPADGRSADTRPMVDRRGKDVGDRGRVRVVSERPGRDDPAVLDIDLERSPVARGHLRQGFGTVSHRGLPSPEALSAYGSSLTRSDPQWADPFPDSPSAAEKRRDRSPRRYSGSPYWLAVTPPSINTV